MHKDTDNEVKHDGCCCIHLTINMAKGSTIILSGGEVDIAGDGSVKGARSVIEGARSIIKGASIAPSSDGLPANYPRVEVLEE